MRARPAPGLVEVAAAWWDRDLVPVVRWSADGRRYWLADADDTERLTIVELADAPADPARVASVLAEGLAGCDFPPTADRADQRAVAATLRSRLGADAPEIA